MTGETTEVDLQPKILSDAAYCPFFSMRHWRRHMVWLITLPLLVIGLYWPSVNFEFVNWDDPWYVIHNPHLEGWSFTNLFRLWTNTIVRNYAPVTIFSYLIDKTLFGSWAGGYHAVNLFWHALNAVLVYALIYQLGRNRFAAFCTAALFAVHPIQVESVVWVSSRKGLLSASFMLAALICWLRPRRAVRHEMWGTLWLFIAF